ncbi:MAG: hypothetical protein ACTHM5_08485 [Ginsengibacter sp.]
MNRNDKILVSLATGIAIGSVLGILLTRDSECERKQDKKRILQGWGKKHAKSSNLKEGIEQAVQEACAENPEDYA